MLTDLRLALRTLARARGFTLVAVLTLALGIGASALIFGVVDAVLLRPLPYADPDRVLAGGISLPDYADLRERARAFDRTAVWGTNRYNVGGAADAEQLGGAIVSPDFFPLLGVRPLVGRTFDAREDREPLAVIGYGVWQRRFGGARDVVGKTLVLSGRPHTVVGVMPPAFQFPAGYGDVWVTLGSAMAGTPEQATDRAFRIFGVLAHVRPGLPTAQARADARAVGAALARQYRATNEGVNLDLVPLTERLLGPVRPALQALLATVGLVLLIACANVANLVLARNATRGRDLAVRASLGARRRDVVRPLLAESLLLAAAGGGLGVLLAALGVRLLPRVAALADIPRLDQAAVDARVALFAVGVSAATAALFGLAPALGAARTALAPVLRGGGRGVAGAAGGARLRRVLVVAEVALSLAVLAGAGLLTRSLARLLSVDTGVVAEHLLTLNVQLDQLDDTAQSAGAVRAARVLEEVARVPGVTAVGGGTGLPPETPQRGTGFEAEGVTIPDPDPRTGYFLAVTPGYFTALGTRLVDGRAFDARDGASAARVVVVNQSLARRLYPGRSAVGRRLRLVNPEQSPEWRTIVGVVGDVRYSGLDDPGGAAVYTPFAQTPFPWLYVMARTATPPRTLAPAVRAAVAAAGPGLRASSVRSMEELVRTASARPRFNTAALSAFALLALGLASVGVYGVIAYTVVQRTRELGVRVALGARPAQVLRLVVGQGARLAGAGVAVGLAGALAMGRLLSSLLFEVGPTDVAAFAGSAALLAGVCVLACLVPARRAARVDPVTALRAD